MIHGDPLTLHRMSAFNQVQKWVSVCRAPETLSSPSLFCAAQQDSKILGQCLLVGLEVGASGLRVGGYGAVYRYLRPLTTEEALVALTQYFSTVMLVDSGDAEEMMTHPIVRTQIAVAGGLPQLIKFLGKALVHTATQHSLGALLNTEKEWRCAQPLSLGYAMRVHQ